MSNSTYTKFLFSFIFSLSILSSHQLTAAQAVDMTPIHEAFVSKFTDPLPLTIVPREPPPQKMEGIPPKPFNDAIWISGYWAWIQEKNDFSWICGVWRRPPPQARFWILGSWNKTDSGWVYARGFWSAIPQNQLKLIQKAPPAAVSDKVPATPGAEYFWAPGYWNYSEASNEYNWLSGKWEKVNSEWILAPASYLWRPSGFVFAPFYWDWPLEKRGVAYNCNGNAPLIAIQPEVIIQRLFVFYPDYCLFYWHWWHFHPGWIWDGCGCVPPWWFWHDWWFFGWSDSWALWWWWGHADFLPPWWLTLELSMQIGVPPEALLDLLKNLPKPLFDIKQGNTLFPPSGSPGAHKLPFPTIPNGVIPEGQITLPILPNGTPPQVTLPLPPAPPQDQSYEPVTPYYPPMTQPQIDYHPENYPPLDYYPPERTPPRMPPHRHDDDYKPSRPYYPDRNITPNYPNLNINPNNSRTPNTPNTQNYHRTK